MERSSGQETEAKASIHPSHCLDCSPMLHSKHVFSLTSVVQPQACLIFFLLVLALGQENLKKISSGLFYFSASSLMSPTIQAVSCDFLKIRLTFLLKPKAKQNVWGRQTLYRGSFQLELWPTFIAMIQTMKRKLHVWFWGSDFSLNLQFFTVLESGKLNRG